MKKIFLTVSMLTFASLSSNTSFAIAPDAEDAYMVEANQNALDNYKALYEEQIKTQLDHIYSGFNRIYEIAPNEDTLFSRLTEDDVLFYASLCSIAYTAERGDFNLITAEINEKLNTLHRNGYQLLGLLKRNLQTLPTLSAILLYNKAENHLVLVYKGTVDKDNNDDWWKNANFTKFSGKDPLGALNAPDGSKLSIHGGFARAYLEGLDEFLPQFRTLLGTHFDDITSNPKPLRVTTSGHSLGGALSTLAANDMRRVLRQTGLALDVKRFIIENINFASPRVYNPSSADKYNRGMGGEHNTVRFVDKIDPVPTVPFSILNSKHVGIPIFIGESGMLYNVAKHKMKDNYLVKSPTALRLLKEEVDYRKYVQDSIVHYKKLLGDTSPNHFGAFDYMNSLKIDLQHADASSEFFKGMLKETTEKHKKDEIEKYLKDLKKDRKEIKEKIKAEQAKFKTGFFNYLKNAVGLN